MTIYLLIKWSPDNHDINTGYNRCADRFATENRVSHPAAAIFHGIYCKGNAMKHCRTCGEFRPLSDYYAHTAMADGHLNICKSCVKERVASHRLINIEKIREYDRDRAKLPHRVANNTQNTKIYRSHFKQRASANSKVSRAVANGKLTKLPCAVCGASRVEGHHPDYDRPLDVVWLCAAHHKQIHLGNQ